MAGNRKICVVNPTDSMYNRFWGNLGEVYGTAEFANDPASFSLICFTGGEDVTPATYRHKDLGSFCSPTRDARERILFNIARSFFIPMTGICRGGQFLNAACGGTMVQDLRGNHGGSHHPMITSEGLELEVTSSHHQMVVPGWGGIVLGWAEKRLRPDLCAYDGQLPLIVRDPNDPESIRVTEAFAYPKLKVFGVQHHPEWQDESAPAVEWTLRMIRKYCWSEEERCA